MEGLGEVTKEEEEMINYLKENFNPFLENLIVDIVKERPNDSYEYILKWLDTKGKDI
jgi:hypothetical protein